MSSLLPSATSKHSFLNPNADPFCSCFTEGPLYCTLPNEEDLHSFPITEPLLLMSPLTQTESSPPPPSMALYPNNSYYNPQHMQTAGWFPNNPTFQLLQPPVPMPYGYPTPYYNQDICYGFPYNDYNHHYQEQPVNAMPYFCYDPTSQPAPSYYDPSSESKYEILKELEGSDNSGSEKNEKTVKGFNSIVSVPWKQRCSPRKKKRVSTSKKNLIKKEWKLKNIPFPRTEEEAKRLCTCTVMIKNIPNQFRRNDLMRELDSFCFEENKISPDDSKEARCQYDLVYLPMDFWYHVTEQRITNLGYAFVNFTSPTAAFRCYKRFNGLKWDVNENKKICEITSAQVQGKEALKKKFCSKIFKTHSPDFLPFELFPPRDGLISEAQTQIISIGKHEFGLPPKRIQRRCACLPLGRS